MHATISISTGYARLSRRQARVVLVAALLVGLFSVGITLSPLKSGFADAPDRGPSDIDLYRAEARRIRAGESYYQAADAELRARGYPTRSLFNWRTPLPIWLVGKLPAPILGRLLLGVLALAAICLSFALMEQEGNIRQGVGGSLLLIGAFLPAVFAGFEVVPELWAAALITLSLCAYSRKRPALGVLLGAAALFFRDLAGLYCLLMGLMALWRRQGREAGLWAAALVAYLGFFAWHVAQVLPLIGPDDLAHRDGWLQCGGLPFLLSTCQMNAWLLLLPQGAAALYFTTAGLGLAGWRGDTGQRIGLAACGYLTLVAAVGHPFNQYWGALFAPLLCFGAARLPASLRDLWRQAEFSPPRLFRRAMG